MTSQPTPNCTRDYPDDFLQDWPGCWDKNCLADCVQGPPEKAHCARLAKAWDDYQTKQKRAA